MVNDTIVSFMALCASEHKAALRFSGEYESPLAMMWRFDGLPLHPLIVHAPVVLIPLVAAGLALFVFRRETRQVLGPILVALALAAAFTAVLAAASGEQLVDDLSRGDSADDHAALGELTRLLAIAMALATAGLVGIDRFMPDNKAARSRGPGLVVATAALVSVVVVGLTGHSGAQLAWEGKFPGASTDASASEAGAPVVAGEASPSTAPTAPTVPAPTEPFVDITLGEWALVTSVDEIPPGLTTFRVRNAGTAIHAFRIRTPGSGGDRLEWRSESIAPGEIIIFTADLPEGTLELTCPIEDEAGEHDELGMQAPLGVRSGAPAPVAPGAGSQSPSGSSVALDISGFAFNGDDVTVSTGAEVTWTNSDSAPHTATGDTFDTGTLATGASASVTFTEPGEYLYICSIHPSMTGRIVVTS